MNTIIPAIIPKSFEDLSASVSLVSPFAKEVQVDIVDGKFVPYTSWPYQGSGAVQRLSDMTAILCVEVDLMIEQPERVLSTYLDAGVTKVVIHLESTDMEQVKEMSELCHTRGVAMGVSIGNDTPLEVLLAQRAHADYVQLMGIPEIGAQGKPFDERVLARVRTLRDQFPDLTISIDGSVNATTLPRLIEAGANRFVAGSALMGAEDPHTAYEALSLLTHA